jgi:hypothetical protein
LENQFAEHEVETVDPLGYPLGEVFEPHFLNHFGSSLHDKKL